MADIRSEISFSKIIIYQLPVVFLFTALWFSLFGGIVLAVLISYLGNVFYDLYNIQEDGKASFFAQTARELNKKDKNQPLLGFTLLALIVILLGITYFYTGSQ